MSDWSYTSPETLHWLATEMAPGLCSQEQVLRVVAGPCGVMNAKHPQVLRMHPRSGLSAKQCWDRELPSILTFPCPISGVFHLFLLPLVPLQSCNLQEETQNLTSNSKIRFRVCGGLSGSESLLCKCEGPSLNYWHPCKKPGMAGSARDYYSGGGEGSWELTGMPA